MSTAWTETIADGVDGDGGVLAPIALAVSTGPGRAWADFLSSQLARLGGPGLTWLGWAGPNDFIIR